MSEKIDEDKIDKAVELLKEAGFDDVVIIGKGLGSSMKISDFHKDYDFKDLAEVQGYIQQVQLQLTAQEYLDDKVSSKQPTEEGGSSDE